MSQVVLIRPGATCFDEQHRLQGRLDLPLCDRGKFEAHQLAGQLSNFRLAALYRGPGESARQTAEIIGKSLDLRPTPLEPLANLDLGLWQGLEVDEIKRRHLRVFKQWMESPESVCPPLGEPLEAAMERVRQVLRPLVRRHRGEPFGIVVSEPLARLVACHLRQDPEIQLEETPSTGTFELIEVRA